MIKDTTKDSSQSEIEKPEWTNDELKELEAMTRKIENIISQEGKRELGNNEELIKRYIREALLVRGLGQDNRIVYLSRLAYDEQVLAAVDVLKDQKGYEKLLEAAKK